MDFTLFTKVEEVRDPSNVNRYMASGWKLLAITQYVNDDNGTSYPVYSLGWNKTENVKPNYPADYANYPKLSDED